MIKPENSAIIAVIVPVYNTEDYLRECLESIRTQTFDNFLCIVVNDGSYDSSSAIAHEIADKDVRFRVYDIPNGGVSAARNLALDVLISMKCQVRYVCFVDSDDVVTPDFLNNFVTLMDRFEADYAECGIHYLYADGFIDGIKLSNPSNECIEHDDIARHMFSTGRFEKKDVTSFMGLCNKCFRLDRIGKVRFDTSLAYCEDQKFCFELYPSLEKEILIHCISYYYRIRGSSATGKNENKEVRIRTDIQVYESILAETTDKTFKEGLATKLLGSLYYLWCDSVRDFPSGTQWIFDALRRNCILYCKLCPVHLRRKLAKIRLGYRINILYLRLRTMESEIRHLRRHNYRIQHKRFR